MTTPENTLPSFQAAADSGASWVEFDVRLSADLRPVVIHDDTLERTTDGEGPVAARPLYELAALDAGRWFDPSFSGCLIPTLEEVLDLLIDLELGFNMELKPVDDRDDQLTEIALETLQAMWPSDAPTPLISSFSPICVEKAKELAPDLPRAFCIDMLSDNWQSVIAPMELTALSVNQLALKTPVVDAILSEGLAIAAWTVNTTDRAEVLWEMGVQSIFTDDTARLMSVLSQNMKTA